MRQFKFRAWDTKLKKMYLNVEVGKEWECNKEGVVIVKFMQHTGLKDKNGKEIFEGDIIQKRDKINGWIEYENGGFHCVKYNKGGAKVQGFHLSLCVDEFEIIGNIYENSELIKND